MPRRARLDEADRSLTSEERALLEGRDVDLVSMRSFLLHDQGLTQTNVGRVMTVVNRLVDTCGVTHAARPSQRFCADGPQPIGRTHGRPVSLSDDFMELQRKANRWLPHSGPNKLDRGNGWALNHPIVKLQEYQRHVWHRIFDDNGPAFVDDEFVDDDEEHGFVFNPHASVSASSPASSSAASRAPQECTPTKKAAGKRKHDESATLAAASDETVRALEARVRSQQDEIALLRGERQQLLGVHSLAEVRAWRKVHIEALRSLQKREEELEEIETTCVVCRDRPRSVAIIPCGHEALCAPCADMVAACPICQCAPAAGPFGRVRVYRA